jgi:GMP synthase (glutamine-hydrolysing)
MTPRVLVVEHETNCPPALFGTWLADAGAEVDVCRPYAGDRLPTEPEHDAIVVLGGSMYAGDDRHAWLEPTRALIRAVGDRQVPTLGICLGHQLCALAFGGRVDRSPLGQQVGLLEIGWTDAAAADDLMGDLATDARGVQWNDDLVLELPEQAVVLAATGRDEVQAARFAPTVWGVQWHPEVDVEVLRVWAEEDADRHLAGGIDQDRVLADIATAAPELDATWRPLAARLVALAERARRASA